MSSAKRPAVEMEEVPSWFIADSACNTVESQRAERSLTEQVRELQQMFPDVSERSIRAALGGGGDLNEVASRLLAGGAPAPAPALTMMTQDSFPPVSLGGATLSSAEGAISGKLLVAIEATDREVALAAAREELAAVGSARGALSPTGQRLVAGLSQQGNQVRHPRWPRSPPAACAFPNAPSARHPRCVPHRVRWQASQAELGRMTLRQLGEGPLRLSARIARTVNELEEGLSLVGGDRVLTKYVIEVRPLLQLETNCRLADRRKVEYFSRYCHYRRADRQTVECLQPLLPL